MWILTEKLAFPYELFSYFLVCEKMSFLKNVALFLLKKPTENISNILKIQGLHCSLSEFYKTTIMVEGGWNQREEITECKVWVNFLPPPR